MHNWKYFFRKIRRSAPNKVVPPPTLYPMGSWFASTVSRRKRREAYHASPYRFLDVCRMHDLNLHVLSTWTHVSSNDVTSRHVSCYPCLASRLKLACYCFVRITVWFSGGTPQTGSRLCSEKRTMSRVPGESAMLRLNDFWQVNTVSCSRRISDVKAK